MEGELICVLDDKLVSELSEEVEKAFFQGIAISLSNETVQTIGTVLLDRVARRRPRRDGRWPTNISVGSTAPNSGSGPPPDGGQYRWDTARY